MADGVKGVPEELLAQLHPLEVKVLPFLKNDTLLSNLAKEAGMQEVETTRALQWLENKGAVTVESFSEKIIQPSANAQNAYTLGGLPEERLRLIIFEETVRKKEGIRIDELRKKFPTNPEAFNPALGILLERGHITSEKGIIKSTNSLEPREEGMSPEFLFIKHLVEKKALNYDQLSDKEKSIQEEFKKRKNYITIKEKKDKRVTVTDLGILLSKVDPKHLQFESNLTREDLESGAWQKKKYRAFDVTVNVPFLPGGRAHFVQEAIEYVRRIWIEMGFEEMEGNMVQSAFWDLDALFVPQDHPAREVQDTFYLSNPSSTTLDRDAFDRVRAVHENGGNTGSLGWRYKFSKIESQKLLLRTHTTAISARTLWAIREGKAKIPGKHFIVNRVFRNEKLDWKHLFEFHQVEGIVIDKNITFAHLIGYLKIFFAKMGYPQIRLRPHHFPYTEPSVEVDVWHPRKEQWIELGGAGMIRPEVTKTLIGEEIPVLAWGLGLERVIVDQFKFTDLRDLYRNDIQQLRTTRHFIGPPEER